VRGEAIRAVALAAAATWAGCAFAATHRVDFAREIRPLLSDRCFNCHGPAESTRMAGLRLDEEKEARRPRGARTPIVAGNAAASEVFKRITAANPALRMPPAASGKKPLTAREAELIRRWIDEGAKWQSHWAFVPPVRPETPAVRNRSWPKNGIDHFVLARLEREGLAPSPEADRARLLRRVSLDITGLPPTLEELRRFEADRGEGAYERAVDRLLASPRYGEKMASDWLDAARYADTHGYQVDPEKEMWAWRDWVIGAFNRNLPFDRFTIEQLAGDMLPNPTIEQRIATGFHRNHRVNTEAGSIAEEFHAENIVDRVSTTGSVWLGLTIGCARCHDHKYDPISMRDFYSLYAFFNNVNEVGTGGPRDGRGNLQPVLRLPAPELEAALAVEEAKVAEARRELQRVEAGLEGGQADWEATAAERQPEWEELRPLKVTSQEAGLLFETQPDGSVYVSGARPDRAVYTFTAETRMTGITGIRFELIPDPRLPGGGSGRGRNGKGVLTEFQAYVAPVSGASGEKEKVDLARITADFSSAESLIDRVLRPMQQLRRGWAVDPEFDRRHFAVIEPANLIGFAGGTRFEFRIACEYGAGATVGRFRISVTNSEFPEPLPESILRTLATPAGGRSAQQKRELRRYYLSHRLPRRIANEAVARAEAGRRAAENRIPSTMVMSEMDKPRETFVLVRGDYTKPGEKAAPAVPGFLPPLPPDAPRNRLGLARWIADPANPLTARVAVNRFWQAYFGTGLVKTSEDFGSQGDPPSHPELLDWLATEFVRTGWDVKAMQKLIVTSATYRQSSRSTAALTARDPENRLLARGPRFRLPAEAIRDQALAVSGLLTEKLGGPPVKPYQPDGLWEQLSVIDDRKLYIRSKGSDLWRRSVYTYWKRTVPPPALTTFDAPTREFCVIKRPMSSTPLQALALMNDETYIEASRKLAERMMREGGAAVPSRLAHGFRLATMRPPSAAEAAVLRAGFERRLARFRRDRAAAEALLGAGESPRDPALDTAELAAYTTAASVILNLDETVTKQ